MNVLFQILTSQAMAHFVLESQYDMAIVLVLNDVPNSGALRQRVLRTAQKFEFFLKFF